MERIESTGSKNEVETNDTDLNCDSPAEIKQGLPEDRFGCTHYRRRCQKKCNECNEFFTCRVCHDESKYHNELDYLKSHKMDRFKVKEIRCLNCAHIQKP